MESVKQDTAFVETMLDRIQALLLHKLQEFHASSPALRHDLGDSQIFPTPVGPRSGRCRCCNRLMLPAPSGTMVWWKAGSSRC